VEIGFRIVGAEHDDDEIERQMAGERRGQIGAAIQPGVVRIVETGGAGAQALLDDMVAIAKFCGHGAGPALLIGIAQGGCGFLHGNPSPCQGISEAQD